MPPFWSTANQNPCNNNNVLWSVEEKINKKKEKRAINCSVWYTLCLWECDDRKATFFEQFWCISVCIWFLTFLHFFLFFMFSHIVLNYMLHKKLTKNKVNIVKRQKIWSFINNRFIVIYNFVKGILLCQQKIPNNLLHALEHNRMFFAYANYFFLQNGNLFLVRYENKYLVGIS